MEQVKLSEWHFCDVLVCDHVIFQIPLWPPNHGRGRAWKMGRSSRWWWRRSSSELVIDNMWAAQIPGCELQVRYYCDIRWVVVSDIYLLSQPPHPGLDPGDRQVLEQKYSGCDPPCLLDSSDGRYACMSSLSSSSSSLAAILGLCWKVWATTLWMWWTAWWPEEATGWRVILNRGHYQTFITRMTSKTLIWVVLSHQG